MMREGYIPKEQRKTILLLSDDLRFPSGVGVMSKEIVLGTAHRFNWVQVGAAVEHPEFGKVMDASNSVQAETGVQDAYLRIYPYNGYGDAQIVRHLIDHEKIDGILHFTDPRYWIWLYHLEHELRQTMPIMYYHVWDDLPYPKYNNAYYQSSDAIFTISKQTHNLVRQVLTDTPRDPWQLKHIPHGVRSEAFRRLTEPEDVAKVNAWRTKFFGNDEVDFVVFYNNRNIRRKMTGDVILAFREFFLALPEEQRKRTRLLLHTQPIDENGTDLPTLIRDCAPEIPVVFSVDRVETAQLNEIYNVADLVINLASAEGFGLGTLEGIMAERMALINVTGGLQDQVGFTDDDGNLLHEDVHYCAEWGSNFDGRYKNHGEWAEVCFPVSRALIGSPPTPYIFDDRCSWEEAAQKIRKVYDLGAEERARRGALGRQYLIDNGYTTSAMCEKFVEGIEDTFENWTPRERFALYKG